MDFTQQMIMQEMVTYIYLYTCICSTLPIKEL